MRFVVGFRVILPDMSAVDVNEASEYVVTDDGALALRSRGTQVRSFLVDGWVDVRSLNLSQPREVDVMLATICVRLGLCPPPEEVQRVRESPPLNSGGIHGRFQDRIRDGSARFCAPSKVLVIRLIRPGT